jgi:hypothetical protein
MKIFEINPPITVTAPGMPTPPGMPDLGTRNFTIKFLTIRSIIVDIVQKEVCVSFLETPYKLKVWGDSDYDSLGNWTQEQFEDAVFEVIKSDPLKAIMELVTYPSIPKEHQKRIMEIRQKNDINKIQINHTENSISADNSNLSAEN